MSQSYSHNMATTQTPHFGILFLDFCVDRAQLTHDCAVARMHICHRHSVGLTSNECAFACAFVLDSVTALTSAVTFAHSNYDNVLSQLLCSFANVHLLQLPVRIRRLLLPILHR